MRKYLLGLILIIIAIFCINLVVFGLKIGKFKINSYNDLAKINDEKSLFITELNNKNSVEFKEKVAKLSKSANNYKNVKAQYDSLVQSGALSDEKIYGSIDIYEMDFLWTILGNYSTQNGVTLQLDVTKSNVTTSISPECVMCDLRFIVTGNYIAITDFVYDLEDDDKLNFEIRNFVMEKGGENLQASFVVKGVPINSKTLKSVATSSTTFIDE